MEAAVGSIILCWSFAQQRFDLLFRGGTPRRTRETRVLPEVFERFFVTSSKGEYSQRRCNCDAIADSLQAAMRKISQYKLIVKTSPESLEQEVNAFLHQQGYELHGSPFCCAECYGQALVKYEHAHATGLPSTLQSHG
jgi:hypothetical protein